MLDCGLDLERVPDRGGSYLLVLRLRGGHRRLRIGALGTVTFAPGYYCYAGSARGGLRARLARHLKVRGKRKHWHIDYLRPVAPPVALLVPDAGAGECALSRSVAALADASIPGFGAGDCRCASHLHYFAEDPLPYMKEGRIR
jgi:sugar fermentation stimulation protein A